MQWLPERIPQILINRELVGQPNKFDVELLGNCDAIIMELCQRLGWTLPIDEAVHEGKNVPERRREQGEKMEEAFEFEAPNRYYFVDANKPHEEGVDKSDEEEEAEAEEEEEGLGENAAAAEKEEDEEEREIERALLKPTMGGSDGRVPSGAGDGASAAGSSPSSSATSSVKSGDEEEADDYQLPGIEVEDDCDAVDHDPSSQSGLLYPPLVSPTGATVASSQGSTTRPSSAQAFSPRWGSQGTPGLGPKPGTFPLDQMLELP